MADFKFPHIQDSITNFLYDEEGNIPRNKVLTIGAMMIVLGILMSDEAFAGHRSHSSHRSHASHSSHSSGSGGHSSHQSHASHTSSTTGGSSHSSGSVETAAPHSNHANHVTHSNVAPTPAQAAAVKAPVVTENGVSELSDIGSILKAQEGQAVLSTVGLDIQSVPPTPKID